MEKYITKIVSKKFKCGYYYKIEMFVYKNYTLTNRRETIEEAVKIRDKMVKAYKKN